MKKQQMAPISGIPNKPIFSPAELIGRPVSSKRKKKQQQKSYSPTEQAVNLYKVPLIFQNY